MIAKILTALAAILVLLVILVIMQPSHYRVERSITIAAPPAVVFQEINDVHRMQTWSPWIKLDPNMKITYEGPPAGIGAIYTWEGNGNAGAGKSTITESRQDELVRCQLDFLKPFAGTATAEYTIKPVGDQTEVTWAMYGPKVFITKAMGLLMSMDKMMGPIFEEGLANLKRVVETGK